MHWKNHWFQVLFAMTGIGCEWDNEIFISIFMFERRRHFGIFSHFMWNVFKNFQRNAFHWKMQCLQDRNPPQGTTFFWNESKLREFFTKLRAYYKHPSKESVFSFLVKKPSMLNILVRCCAEKWNSSSQLAQQVLLKWNWKKSKRVW